MTKPCQECDQTQRKITKQRSDLQQHIQREQLQQLQQRIQQQQQELDQFTQQESQDASQRDITSELQSKQQLLSQLNQELRQIQQLGQPGEQQPGGASTTGPTPTTPPGSVPTLAPPQPTQPPQPSSLYPPQAQSNGVTFCVGCDSEEDAILFLNGEPAKCSVIPGSTQPLAIHSPDITPVGPPGIDPRVSSLGSKIGDALTHIGQTINRQLCAHPIIVRAAYEAPVAALVAGLVAECPECAVAAGAIGQRLVDAAVNDFTASCGG
jgi:hypothetical protein